MSTTYRSGTASILRWTGPAVAVLTVVVFVPLPIILVAAGAGASTLLLLLFVPIGVVAGILLFLKGQRSRVIVSADAVTWGTLFGAARTVPFQAVRGVETPTARRGPRTLRLHLHDGSVVPVSAIGMVGGEGGNSADAGYLRAAQAITAAHHAWWSDPRNRSVDRFAR